MNTYTERQTSGIDWPPFISDQPQLLGNRPNSSAAAPEYTFTTQNHVSLFDTDRWLVDELKTPLRPLYELYAKTVRPSRAGVANLDYHEKQIADYKASQEATLAELRQRFVMPSDSAVSAFLTNHRSLPHFLTEAAERLKDAFGESVIINLEVSTDEDGDETLYGIAMWQAGANSAARAFNSFIENWWLHRMNASTADVAFVYKLV